jgi:hypothetical protein
MRTDPVKLFIDKNKKLLKKINIKKKLIAKKKRRIA